MAEKQSSKRLGEVIEEERDGLIMDYPESREQIIQFANGASQAINKTLDEGDGKEQDALLDDLCATFDFIEEDSLGSLPPEIQKEITDIRLRISTEIKNGDIQLGKIDQLSDPVSAEELTAVGNLLKNYSRIEFDQNTAEDCFIKGFSLREDQRYEEAVKIFKKALALNPKKSLAKAIYEYLINCLVQLDRYKEVIDIHQEASRMGLNESTLDYGLGVVLYKLERFEEAVKVFQKALALNPKKSLAKAIYENLIYSLLQLDRYEEVIDIHQEAMRIGLNDSNLDHGLGTALHSLKRFEEALTIFKKIVEHVPDIHLLIGSCLSGLERPEEAVEEFEKHLKNNPDDAKGFMAITMILKQLGRKEEAKKYFIKGHEIDSAEMLLHAHIILNGEDDKN